MVKSTAKTTEDELLLAECFIDQVEKIKTALASGKARIRHVDFCDTQFGDVPVVFSFSVEMIGENQ